MRRLLLSGIIVALAVTPSLYAWCAAACDDPLAGRSGMPACHQQKSANGVALSATHDCSRHAPAPALVAASTTRLQAPLLLRADAGCGAHMLDNRSIAHDTVAGQLERLPQSSHAPLRL